MTISKFTKEILDKILFELNTVDNRTKIEKNLVEPLLGYTFNRLYPYLLLTGIIFILTFLLVLFMLLVLIKQMNKSI
tara:strand:- start:81 stop:311 length:231 start_codon:yes stop_codon:yes gene_type:complete